MSSPLPDFHALDFSTPNYQEGPGALSRLEPATGLLVRGVMVNGNYLICESCTVAPTQEIDVVWYLQGGPRSAIANIGAKQLTGQITVPLRVGRNGQIEAGARVLLENAEKPLSTLRIDTNHTFTYLGITAEGWGSDGNERISFDSAIVKELTLSVSQGEGVKLTATIIGTVVNRAPTDLVAPPTSNRLGKQISFNDCDASRHESAMRTVTSISLQIQNEVETPLYFIPNDNTEYARSDWISDLVVHKTRLTATFEEFVRRGGDRETYLHGGWMENENLTLDFAVVTALFPTPLFSIAEQSLTSRILQRKTTATALMSPSLTSLQGGIFSFI